MLNLFFLVLRACYVKFWSIMSPFHLLWILLYYMLLSTCTSLLNFAGGFNSRVQIYVDEFMLTEKSPFTTCVVISMCFFIDYLFFSFVAFSFRCALFDVWMRCFTPWCISLAVKQHQQRGKLGTQTYIWTNIHCFCSMYLWFFFRFNFLYILKFNEKEKIFIVLLYLLQNKN